MLIDSKSLSAASHAMASARRSQSAQPSNMLDAYLPAEKAEKFKSYDALAGDTRAWQSGLRARGILDADLSRMTKAGDDYLPILQKALDAQAFADPKAFLKTLSASELQTLQHTHSLADPIAVDGLSQEASLNLVLPPGDSNMDTDGDGLVSVGAAKMITFPPANAPKAVDDAWAAATAGVDPGVQLTLVMTMHLASPGRAGLSSGDASAPGPMDLGDFRALVAHALEGLVVSRRFQNAQQQAYTDRMTSVLDRFDTALAARQA